jgi:hypothetical protein
MHKPHDRGENDVLLLREKQRSPKSYHIQGGNQGLVKGLGKIAISPDHSISNVFLVDSLDYNLLSVSQLCKMGVLEGQLYLVDFNRAELDICLIAKTNMGWLWHR